MKPGAVTAAGACASALAGPSLQRIGIELIVCSSASSLRHLAPCLTAAIAGEPISPAACGKSPVGRNRRNQCAWNLCRSPRDPRRTDQSRCGTRSALFERLCGVPVHTCCRQRRRRDGRRSSSQKQPTEAPAKARVRRGWVPPLPSVSVNARRCDGGVPCA